MSRSRSPGQKNGMYRKVLSQAKHMSNMKALSQRVQKLWSMLTFLKSRSKVKVTRSENMACMKMVCHNDYYT